MISNGYLMAFLGIYPLVNVYSWRTGKSPCLSSVNPKAIFNSYVTNYQRVLCRRILRGSQKIQRGGKLMAFGVFIKTFRADNWITYKLRC